jgi:Tol biopolymer transport system component
VLGKALGGFAVLVVFACGAGMAHAAYPGVNGKIVYEHKADQYLGTPNPWTITPGIPASAQLLVDFEEDAYNFAYSPNGKRIAFDAAVPSGEIVLMKANGRRPTVLTGRLGKCIGKQYPTWSHDGRKIAFVCTSSRNVFQHDVWSINVDGTGAKRISDTHDADIPVWSPDGDQIAYEGSGGTIYTVPATGGQSHVVSEEGPNPTGISSSGIWRNVDWSPDGETLVAESSPYGVYTLDPDTGSTSGLLAQGGAEPVFSPDGQKIAYVNVAQNLPGGKLEIWMMDATGGNKQRVTTGGYDRAPNWQPLPPPG